jgi:hypothetical protein
MSFDYEFYKFPVVVFDDQRLSSSSKKLFCLLLHLSADKGYCHATNSYLAEKLGVKVRQLQMYLSELRAHDYIECSEDSDKKGSRQITIEPNFWADFTAEEMPEQ